MSYTDEQTYQIIGAAMKVHTSLGNGFLEAVYQEALQKEFKHIKLPFEREKELPIFYRNSRLKTHYRADFICFGSVILELKSIRTLTKIEEAQTINYLKASGLKKALLINFGNCSLEHKRMVLDYKG